MFLKGGRCSFEQIFLQYKDENRRFTGGKSRFEDAVVHEKMPKMCPPNLETHPSQGGTCIMVTAADRAAVTFVA